MDVGSQLINYSPTGDEIVSRAKEILGSQSNLNKKIEIK